MSTKAVLIYGYHNSPAEVVPKYEIEDNDPGNWKQGEDHDLTVKRTYPVTLDGSILLDITCEGGDITDGEHLTDDGSSNWQGGFTVLPSSDNVKIGIKSNNKDVELEEEFEQEEIELIPKYKIEDTNPSDWIQTKEHSLIIKRTYPITLNEIILLNVTCEGGNITIGNQLTDNGNADWNETIKLLPNSNNIKIQITSNNNIEINDFTKNNIEKITPRYSIVDNDSDNWEQDTAHNLKIKRLTPVSFNHELKIDLNITGGVLSDNSFIDNGNTNFEKDITITPNSENINLTITLNSELVADNFVKSDIKKPFVDPINFDGAKFVDLGLPSGTLWASCDLGSPHPLISHLSTGCMYAFGCLTEEDVWKNPDETYSKYIAANVTEETKIDLEDDVAHHLDPEYCTPTKTQWDELIANTWCTFRDVEESPRYTAWILISKINNNKLFLGGGLDTDRYANSLFYNYGSYGPTENDYGFVLYPFAESTSLSLRDFMMRFAGRATSSGIRPVKYIG